MSLPLINITEAEDLDDLLGEQDFNVIVVCSDEFAPSEDLIELIQDIAENFDTDFYKVDAGENEELADKLNIESFPATVIASKGEIKAKHLGGNMKESRIRSWLENKLPQDHQEEPS